MRRDKKGLQGNVADLRKLAKRLREMPVTVAHDVAKRSTPVLTVATRTNFAKRRSVYGMPYGNKVDGSPVTLVKTETVKKLLRFENTGTVIRCVLGPRYSKYLIGKYKILPIGVIPVGWVRRMKAVVEEQVDL